MSLKDRFLVAEEDSEEGKWRLIQPRNEVTLVKVLYEEVKRNRDKISSLTRVCRGNKAVSQLIRQMGREWRREELWGEEEIPDVKPDLIFVFGNIVTEEALIVTVEIKYFRKDEKGKISAFYEGLQQTMAYAVFGFDGIALWQIFSEEVSDKVVEFYAKEVQELVKGFRLPLFNLAAKLIGEVKLRCFAPWQLSDP